MTACRSILTSLILLMAGPATGQIVVVASQQGARLTRIEGEAVAGSFTVPASPAVVAADGRGRLYASHPDGRSISMIEPDGTVHRLPVQAQAFGLAVEPDGSRLYVGDWSGNRVLCLSPATGPSRARSRSDRTPPPSFSVSPGASTSPNGRDARSG